MDFIQMASQLRHPSIVRLIGYCVQHGQHLVVYEYVRNLSLDDALHNEVSKRLSWGYVFVLLLVLHSMSSVYLYPLSTL